MSASSDQTLLSLRRTGKAIDIIGRILSVICVGLLILASVGLVTSLAAPNVELPYIDLVGGSSFVRNVIASIPEGSVGPLPR